MPWAAVAAVGAVVSAGATIAGGIAQGQQASYQAQVARNNATIANQNAVHAAEAGAAQTEQAGLKARQEQGRVRAALAANGVDVNSGSAADVQSSERQLGYLDTATVANKAALGVYGYKTQGANYTAQAGLDQAEAGFDPIAGVMKGVGGLASAYPGFAGGGSSGSAGAATETGTYDASHTGGDYTSLLSGAPSLSSSASWMYSPTNPTDGTY